MERRENTTASAAVALCGMQSGPPCDTEGKLLDNSNCDHRVDMEDSGLLFSLGEHQ